MKKEQRMTQILLLCYLILLTWIILFKLQLPTDGWIEYRSVNLIPFGASVVIDGAIDFREIFNNVWIFLPFGLYLGMLKPAWSFGRKLLAVVALSVTYEVLQYVLAIGASDITDVITNTLGGAAGLLLFMGLFRLGKDKTHVVLNRVALVGTILIFGLVFVALFLSTP